MYFSPLEIVYNYHYFVHFRDMFHYDDVTIPQVLSDVDIMEEKDPPQSSPGTVVLIIVQINKIMGINCT